MHPSSVALASIIQEAWQSFNTSMNRWIRGWQEKVNSHLEQLQTPLRTLVQGGSHPSLSHACTAPQTEPSSHLHLSEPGLQTRPLPCQWISSRDPFSGTQIVSHKDRTRIHKDWDAGRAGSYITILEWGCRNTLRTKFVPAMLKPSLELHTMLTNVRDALVKGTGTCSRVDIISVDDSYGLMFLSHWPPYGTNEFSSVLALAWMPSISYLFPYGVLVERMLRQIQKSELWHQLNRSWKVRHLWISSLLYAFPSW